MNATAPEQLQDLFPVTTSSVHETMDLGEVLANRCGPGSVLALYGELGTGKTHLVKGIARGLGISPSALRSPTFTILRIYEEGRHPLYHFDAYRVQNPDEFIELGYEEYVYSEGVTCIEWADRVQSLIPPDALSLRLTHVAPTQRRIVPLDVDNGSSSDETVRGNP